MSAEWPAPFVSVTEAFERHSDHPRAAPVGSDERPATGLSVCRHLGVSLGVPIGQGNR